MPTPPPPPSLSLQYTNDHHSSPDTSHNEPQTTVVENGRSDHDLEDEVDNNDGDQWSDWEHDSVPPEFSIEISQPISSPPLSTVQEQVISKPVSSSNKSLKSNNMSKSKWNLNTPLDSEYVIPPVISNKEKSITTETSNNQDTDDFFKDMAPKVQTVELMQQLETRFHVNADQPSEQTKPATTKTTKAAVPTSSSSTTTFSNKFGVMSPDHEDNQELDTGNNNWDE